MRIVMKLMKTVNGGKVDRESGYKNKNANKKDSENNFHFFTSQNKIVKL